MKKKSKSLIDEYVAGATRGGSNPVGGGRDFFSLEFLQNNTKIAYTNSGMTRRF